MASKASSALRARGIGGSDEYQMWQMDTASEMRTTHVGLVNQGATCYMNSLLQQLFMVPGFRDGFLAAAPPLPQRSAVVDELQRCRRAALAGSGAD